MRHYRILHTEASTGWGGQEIRIITESAGMIQRGHKVMLACQPRSVISERAHDHGIETFVMRLGGAFDIAGIRRLRALMQKQKIDIVNTHSSKDSWCAGLAAKLSTDVKAVRTRHLGAPIKSSFETRLLYHVIPDAVVTAGEAVRKHVIERTGALPEAVVSIPTGIDLDMFDPEKADGARFRSDIGVGADDPLVGTVGMLRVMKGLPYLIEAAADVIREAPETKFVIIGDIAFESDIKERLAKQISSLGIEDGIIMAGYRSDMPNAMAGLDIFVLPSLVEGVSQVINQAAAMKRPVIGTNVGSVYEQIIDGQTGFLIEKANSAQIRDAILALLRDRERARRMGENGRKLVEEKFSLEAMLDATEALYRRLLGST